MAIFSHLNLEESIQVNDRTRFDASKSFVSQSSSAITTLTVTPGSDGSPISVFSSTVSSRVLDWEFDTFNHDIDATNNKLDFEETSGVELTATLSTATYTIAGLVAEIATQLDATGALTYTVTASTDDKITIVSTAAFNLLPDTGTNKATSAWGDMGFVVKLSENQNVFGGKTTYTGKRIRSLTKKVSVITGDGVGTTTDDFYIKLFSQDGDMLFSEDSQLLTHESKIFKYLAKGKNTFINTHRLAQETIVKWLDEQGYTNVFADPFTVDDLFRVEEFQRWSKFLTLKLIFEGLVNKSDDIFDAKTKKYFSMEQGARARAVMRVDIDRDGEIDTFEDIESRTGRFFRR